MYYKKFGYPEEDDIVLCTVTSVQYNSVFVNLDDYSKQGFIHISEVSPGRIRNLRDFVKEGKVVVCKVLRVNPQRGHIDVSLRRVNEVQRRSKLEERKSEQKAEKIVETLATQLKEEPQKVYDTISQALLPHYEFLTYAFTDVVENNASLKEAGLDERYATPLHDLVIDRIKPKQVMIEGDLSITSYAANGLEMVKHALVVLANPSLDTRYLGAGTWRLIVTAPEYKDAEKILKTSLDASQAIADKDKSAFSFKRKE